MKRGFASVLWGSVLKDNPKMCNILKERFDFDLNPTCKMSNRMSKIHRNIRSYVKQGYKDQSTVYVFGKENQEYVNKLGLKSVLIQDDPYKYHPTRGIYMHKLLAYQYIMEDFDEVVLLDFDMLLESCLPNDFWKVLNQRESFQASLHGYRTKRIKHREGKENKWIPAGALVYMRDKSIPEKLIRLNTEGVNKWSCEPAFAYLTDEMTDGWKGLQTYWELFEPQFYSSRKSPYRWNKEKYQKNICFKHGHLTRGA